MKTARQYRIRFYGGLAVYIAVFFAVMLIPGERWTAFAEKLTATQSIVLNLLLLISLFTPLVVLTRWCSRMDQDFLDQMYFEDERRYQGHRAILHNPTVHTRARVRYAGDMVRRFKKKYPQSR